MHFIQKTTLRALAFATLLLTLLPSVTRAQDNKEWFTVVLFGDPEIGQMGRPGNTATPENVNKWADGIIHMGETDGIQCTFDNAPAGFVSRADLVICMGDLDGDQNSHDDIKTVFNKFNANNIPFVTLPGNHDLVPDYWGANDKGLKAFGTGGSSNEKTFTVLQTYRDYAEGKGITIDKTFIQSNGNTQPKPFAFSFKGVRFFIGQTYWFYKPYTWSYLSGATYYAPNGIINELTTYVSNENVANTPSVWVQHFPISCEDRWWQDGEDGLSIAPKDTPLYGTADAKREKYKELITSTKRPVHFSGHAHSMRQDVFTKNGKTFTDYVAPYFATNGSAYVALCNSEDGVVEVKTVCFDPAYHTPTVSDIDRLSNDKAYTIRAQNGYLTYNSSVTNAASGVSGTPDNTVAANQWAIVNQSDNLYLYNVAAGKFARKPASSTNSYATVLDLVDTPDLNCIVTFEPNTSNADYPWLIKFSGVTLNVSPGYTDKYGIWMGGWTTLDGGNQFAISEAADFEGFQTVKEKLTNAGMADLVSVGNLTTGWYQLWTETTEVIRSPKLITSVDQLYSPKSDTHDNGAEGHLENLIDDDASSYWHSQWGTRLDFGSEEQLQHYVQFDLGDTYQNLTFVYRCRNHQSNKPTSFAVIASNSTADNTFVNVGTISDVETDPSKLQYFYLNLGATYRYVRLRATATAGEENNRGFWHAAEMQFYPGTVKPKLITAASQMSSPKSAPENEGVLGHLIDDDPETYWHSNWNGESPAMNSEAQMLHYAQFDLGSAYQDLTLAYRCRNFHSDKPTAFAVTASNSADGTFTQVATITDVSIDPNELQYFHFDMGATYRYIRLRATATGGNNSNRGYWHAAEMQFYPGELDKRTITAYYKTLNISGAPTINGNTYDMASAENSTDLNTLFYIEKVGNGQVKFHLPTGYGVGTDCSRANEPVSNVVTVTAPDTDPGQLQLKNDAAHGGGYWAPLSDANYSDGLIIGTGSANKRWKLIKANEMLMDYDVWTVMPAVEGASMPNVTYTAAGYTGVREFVKGGKLFTNKGVEPSPEDFTVAEEGATVAMDAENKQILVKSKVYRLGQRITDLSQIKSGGKYMIMHAHGRSQHGFFSKWVTSSGNNFALESGSLPATLQLEPALDMDTYAGKIWTFTTVSGGYSITNGSKTQTISLTDYGSADAVRTPNIDNYPDPRFYFEDMGDGARYFSTCAEGDGFWTVRNGTSGNTYWNATGGAAFATWSNGHPYTIFAVEETEGLEVNYGVNASAKGFMNRSDNRHYEWVSLKVGTNEPVKIEGLQQKTGNTDEFRPIYFNRTGVTLDCQAGATLTAAVDGTNTSGMQALFFIDKDGDGFEDEEGFTSSTLEVSGITAPTKPGSYRVRFLVVNNSTDPAGYANIATDGGIIVDATLEVQPCTALLAELAELIASIEAKVGAGLGKYAVNLDAEEYATDMEGAKAMANDEASAMEDLQTAIDVLSAWTFTINQPQAGQFFRIHNAATTDNYATNDAKVVTTTGPNTVFYYTNDVLLGYSNGKCPQLTGDALITDNTIAYSFSEAVSNPGKGQYNVKWGGSYIYDVGTGNLDGGTSATSEACNWTLEEVKALPVAIGSSGYASFYTPVAVTVPTGAALPEGKSVKAYVATKHDTYLHLEPVTTIPAGEGVVLKGDANTTYDFAITDADSSEESALDGKVTAFVSAEGDYVLSKGTIDGQGGQVGFFPVRENEVIPGFKAYLPHETAAGVRAFSFSFDELATAIDAATDESLQDGVTYNIRGQRVQKAGGLIIVNGKKVMVK